MLSWARCVCGILFASGCVLAAWLVIVHGLPGMLLAFPALAIAWLAADRADPTKWSQYDR